MKNLLKNVKLIAVAILLVILGVAAGCNSTPETADTAKSDVAQAERDLAQAKEDYQAELAKFKMEQSQQISANEQMIADIKIKIKSAKKDMVAEYTKQLEELEQNNTRLKNRMEAYNEEELEKWDAFKKEFSRDMDELGKSLKNFSVSNK